MNSRLGVFERAQLVVPGEALSELVGCGVCPSGHGGDELDHLLLKADAAVGAAQDRLQQRVQHLTLR